MAIQRSLAHCGYHVGQIVLVARILAGENWETITIPEAVLLSSTEEHGEQLTLGPRTV
jgi:hypothetical protein